MQADSNPSVPSADPFPPSPELRTVKALIWAQSVTGAALVFGFLWSVFTDHERVLAGVVLCGVPWVLNFRPIAARAGLHARPSLAPLSEVHRLVLFLWGVAQVGTLCMDVASLGPSFMVNLAANFFLLLLILLRGVMSISMDIPINRGTWYGLMAVAGLGFLLRALMIAMFITAWGGR